MASSPEFRIGCSGWSYNHWRGNFYPVGVPPGRWLEHYAEHFDTVELNASFYRLPSESTVRAWRQRTPAGFRFAVKASRYITHLRRFANCEGPLEQFFGRMLPLGDRLGPMLYQAPPAVERDDQLLARFLRLLPPGPLHAFEFRHPSWWADPVYELLNEHGASLVAYNMGETGAPLVPAANVYARLHGPGATYASPYSQAELIGWRNVIQALPGVERAWIYFNNDIGGHAPRDAARMSELVVGSRSPR